MKQKRFAFLLLIIFTVLSFILMSACDEDSDFVSVKFYVDGDLYRTVFVERGGSMDLEVELPNKEGMQGEWSIKDFEEINENLRVDAVYSNAYCNITFTADGKTVETFTVKKNSSPDNLPDVPEKEGYVGHWNYTDFNNITTDITVEAVYETKYLNIYFMQGEAVYATRRVAYGEDLEVVPTVPASSTNISAKWVDLAGNTPDYTKIKEDLYIYVKYFLTIELIDSGLEDNIKYFDLNKKVENIIPAEKEYFDFYGWYYDSDFQRKVIFPLEFAENCKIYARYIKTTVFTDFTFATDDNNNGILTGYTGNEENVVVPYRYEDANGEIIEVTAIGDEAFLNNEKIVTLSLPGTIKTIGKSSFINCTSLKEVMFPDINMIEIIGENAFGGCKKLEIFSFGQNLKEIKSKAFTGCAALKNIDLSNTRITTITDAFTLLSDLQQIGLPDTLEKIENNAFLKLYNAQFTFGNTDSIISVGDGAFAYCNKLHDFTAINIKSLGNAVFEGCENLKKVTMLSNMPLYTLFGKASDNTEKFYKVAAASDESAVYYYLPLSLSKIDVVANTATSDTQRGIVAANAFKDAFMIKEIEFLGEFTTIEKNAFYISDSEKVTDGFLEINFPVNLKRIDESAFAGRTDIKTINLPASIESIGKMAFYNLPLLQEVTIENNNKLSFVGKDAFKNTMWFDEYNGIVRLGSVALGYGTDYINAHTENSLTEIGLKDIRVIAPYAFSGIVSLTTVVLPSTVTTVGEFAFDGCTNLNTVRLPKELVTAGDAIFNNCPIITTLRIGVGKDIWRLFGKTISQDNTYSLERDEEIYQIPLSLRKLELFADGKTEILPGKYNDLISLEEIVVGTGITRIHDNAFSGCTMLKTFAVGQDIEEIGYSDNESVLGVFNGCTALEELIIPANSKLRKINDYSFKNTAINKLVVPKSVIYIGKEAFYGTKLKTLLFESGTESLIIKDGAFKEIKTFLSSAKVILPDNLKEIGSEAFRGCSNLTYAEMPNNLTALGQYIFAECDLKEFVVPDSIPVIFDEKSGLYNITGLLKDNLRLTKLTLNVEITAYALFDGNYPSGLSSVYVSKGKIANGAFKDLKTLENAVISAGVTEIGQYAFYGCDNTEFKFLEIPYTVTAIHDYALSHCANLSSVIFSSEANLKILGKYVFAYASALKEIDLPNSLDSTEMTGVFEGCESLNRISIPETVIKIGENTFKDNNSLKEIAIPKDIEIIGDYAFYNCYNLFFENNYFEKLEVIGKEAFRECKKLQKIKAANIKDLGKWAFYGCDYMTEISLSDGKIISNEDNNNAVGDSGKIQIINIASSVKEFDVKNLRGASLNAVYFESESVEDIKSILEKIRLESTYTDKQFFIKASLKTALADYNDMNLQFYPIALDAADLDFNEIDNTVKLKKFNSEMPIVYLPTTIENNGKTYTLTEIEASAFVSNAVLQAVYIPASIVKIGKNAFSNCDLLSYVSFETGIKLEEISEFMFDKCKALRTIELPDSVITIKTGAFSNCDNLDAVSLTSNSKLAEIEKYAFNNCPMLQTIKVAAVPKISEKTFSGNTNFNSGKFIVWQ